MATAAAGDDTGARDRGIESNEKARMRSFRPFSAASRNEPLGGTAGASTFTPERRG